ncbi:LysR family transcriptional regulator [Microbacterium gorillae]|uniref:LysR family transcriptional regulator n=1 Tax=Microbacterium gorillae TaxID=1231063 RepID=UPI00069329A6|nr:LysR family transcriptional regulator [Microbacterium gorillae]
MASFDLDLMDVFMTIARAGSLTRAAERLHVTQPSVSHALARLRVHFGDPLFVRTRGGVRPTAFAQDLIDEIEQPLEVLRSVMGSAADFDPATSQRRYRLALTDIGEAALLPWIMAELLAQAPGISVEVVQIDIHQVGTWITEGSVDAAIVSTPLEGPFESSLVMVDKYGCVVGEDVELVDGRIGLDDFRSRPRAVVTETTGHEVARAMARAGGPDSPTVLVPHFAAMPQLVLRAGLVGVVPRGAVTEVLGGWPLRIAALPFEVDTFEVRLYWQGRHRLGPAQRWLISTIQHALADVQPDLDARTTNPSTARRADRT